VARRPSHRPERVGELLRELIAGFLTDQVRDPRIGFVTVTGVEVSPDLGHARVRVTVMGAPEERARTLEGLASAARFLRTRLAHELHLRTAPELRFELDRGLEHAMRIEEVLRNLKEGTG
jgi:ribosome-binding factor A